jgi:hypothetical protein
MSEQNLIVGGVYRHFKGKLYQVKGIATHSETKEPYIIYQRLYPPYDMWIRPREMFLGFVDKVKYPQVKQKYRFQLLSEEEMQKLAIKDSIEAKDFLGQTEKQNICEQENPATGKANSLLSENEREGDVIHIVDNGQNEQDIAQKGFMAILDAPTFQMKAKLFLEMRQHLTERMIHDIALSYDMTLKKGSRDENFDEVLHNLRMMERFEGGRLRP